MSNATQLSTATWYSISRQFRDILELCYIIVKFIHPLQQLAIGPWQPYNYPLHLTCWAAQPLAIVFTLFSTVLKALNFSIYGY